jgi:gluconolactonase
MVDSRGNVFSTGPGGIWIYSPEGTLLDRISTPEYASNLAFGGVGYKTLFITATHDIYSIPVKYSGEHQ